MKRKGFSIVELAVVLLVVVLLTQFIPPTLRLLDTRKKRAACQGNLGSIAKALALYKGEFNDSYPWLFNNNDSTLSYDFTSDMNEWNEDVYSLIDSKHLNCATNLAMLPFKGTVSYKGFICPAGKAMPSYTRADKHGFVTGNGTELQYGYHAGWKYGKTAGKLNPGALSDNLAGDFVIMGDYNPGLAKPLTTLDDTKWTHGKNVGVNIMCANASVQWKAHEDSGDLQWDLGGGGLYDAGNGTEPGQNVDMPVNAQDSVLYVNSVGMKDSTSKPTTAATSQTTSAPASVPTTGKAGE